VARLEAEGAAAREATAADSNRRETAAAAKAAAAAKEAQRNEARCGRGGLHGMGRMACLTTLAADRPGTALPGTVFPCTLHSTASRAFGSWPAEVVCLPAPAANPALLPVSCRLQEQLRAAAVAQRAAEARCTAAEAALEGIRREADARASTIRWLESQVSCIAPHRGVRVSAHLPRTFDPPTCLV
jgi:hypothetical protein